MKINNANFLNTNDKQNNIKLAEGSILTAKLVDIVDNEVLIDLGNGNFLSGKTEIDLQSLKDKMLNFLIKSLDNNMIELKPLLGNTHDNNNGETATNNKKIFINRILDLYKIENNNANIEVIDNMIKFQMTLSKESVLNVVKYINKLESIISITENEKLYLLEPNQNLYNSDISKIIKNKDDEIVMGKDAFNLSEATNNNTVEEVLSQIKNIAPKGKLTPEIIKKAIFLIKSDISVTINNIKQLINIIDKGNLLEENINLLSDELYNDSLISKGTFESIKNRLNSFVITFTQNDNVNASNYYSEISSIIELIHKTVITKNNISDDLSDKIQELNDCIYFINKLNENIVFYYLPFTIKDDIVRNSFYMLNKKKHMKTSDKISIFLRLETKNLAKIEVMCIVINDSINLDFKVKNQFLSLFEEKKMNLYKTLNAIGYSKVSILVNQNSEKDILDLLASDEYLNYKLNVKV